MYQIESNISNLEEDIKLDFSDVLIRPNKTDIKSRNDVDLERNFYFPKSKQSWKGIPIMSSNMDTIGTYEVYKVLSTYKILTVFHKFYSADDFLKMDLDKNYFVISTGITDNDFKRLTEILDKIDVKFICIDVANGYMKSFLNFCQKIRLLYPNKILIAGNIVCKNLTKELLTLGIDIVKVGIGNGSACTTRIKTGIGVPQLSAIIDCHKEALLSEGYVVGDGGITCPGDVVKGLGAGADFIMIGGQFAGHDENPGELIVENGVKFKQFYGMSSDTAMINHYGEVKKYKTSEGRTLKIKYKGRLEDTIIDYLGGVRSACAYLNVDQIKDITNKVNFIRVNNQFNKIFI